MNISNLRSEYENPELTKSDLSTDPVVQFEKWFKEASDANIREVNAMSLATVNKEGQPSQRTVLLKYYDKSGFVFFTNLKSRKALEIEENAKVAILFFWADLKRQIRMEGLASKISTLEASKYFATRPRGSQIGAWVSEQSEIISSRQLLHQKFVELKASFLNKSVPMPSFWGGYKIVPHTFEFWQGQVNRLHDRFHYSLEEDGEWSIERLQP